MKDKNIVLITIDCLRADHMTYMHKLMEIEEKIFFKNAFANATYTGLSVPSFLTSLYPPIESPKPTIASYLKEKRYRTAAFAPNALLLDQRYRKLKIERGFDIYKNYLREDISGDARRAFNKLLTGLKDAINLFSKYIPRIIRKSLLKGAGFMPFSIWLPYPRAEKVLDDAKNWFEKTKKPVFMWVHLMDAHEPYFPPEKYRSVDKNTISIVNRRLRFARGWLPKEDVEILHRLYIDNIKYIDDVLNDFLDNILDENTIAIITADHGEQFLEHGGIGHLNWNMYDEQLHIPLIILNCGKEKKDNLVSLIDVAPTIAYLADIEIQGFMGNVLLEDYEEKPVFFAGYDKKWNVLYGIRTKEWKLFRGVNGWELYNVVKDPREKKNIYQEEAEIALKLKRKLLEILEKKRKIEKEDKKLEEIAKKMKKIEQ